MHRTLEIISWKVVSSTRPYDYSGTRENHQYYWAVSIDKQKMQDIGWWRSRPETQLFETKPHHESRYCELTKYEIPTEKGLFGTRTPKKWPKHIHKIRPQEGNRVRLFPYLGNVRFDPLDEFDPDTLVEYFPKTDVLRIYYPLALRIYQQDFYKR